MLPTKLIAITFLLSKIGGLTNAIMVLYKGSINYKLFKNMEKNKFKSGEEAMIFLRLNYN